MTEILLIQMHVVISVKITHQYQRQHVLVHVQLILSSMLMLVLPHGHGRMMEVRRAHIRIVHLDVKKAISTKEVFVQMLKSLNHLVQMYSPQYVRMAPS